MLRTLVPRRASPLVISHAARRTLTSPRAGRRTPEDEAKHWAETRQMQTEEVFQYSKE